MLFFALVTGAAVAILFTVFPQWDLAITGLFWDAGSRSFQIAASPLGKMLRSAGNIIPWLFAGPAFAAIILKLLFPKAPMFMSARAALLLALSMALAPGLLVNGVLKEYWGRPRPVHVETFGGKDVFSPWYSTDGTCPGNCSFVSGEGSLGFWMLAPASLAPAPLRPVAVGAALAFGMAAGGLRIAFGGHFFTDTVFSALLTILVIVALRWLLYDRKGALSSATLEDGIGKLGLALNTLLLALMRALWWVSRTAMRKIAHALRALPLPWRRSGL
ncbi:MAG: phosphatase PAP2 family protein [Pseudomonadota bacterium]|uniref:phosphatase PAP2 family protein n=1 Tax=Roseixanthobacter finlandensis TaxID=3119922 RepID=UPI002CA86FFB|nr:phosphatase PAP2 family protein [Xanthobacteraceae bacterium]